MRITEKIEQEKTTLMMARDLSKVKQNLCLTRSNSLPSGLMGRDGQYLQTPNVIVSDFSSQVDVSRLDNDNVPATDNEMRLQITLDDITNYRRYVMALTILNKKTKFLVEVVII